jgi:hypothetical protein
VVFAVIRARAQPNDGTRARSKKRIDYEPEHHFIEHDLDEPIIVKRLDTELAN